MKKIICLLCAAFLLSACVTTKLTEGGEKIRMLDPGEVSTCKNMARTTSSVPAKFVFNRPADVVAEELATLARNSASHMGGDTIVPLTVIEDGRQTFEIYKCVNPDG